MFHAMVNKRKVQHLKSKELSNFKLLVVFVIFVYGVALPLWFVCYGDSILRVNDRWTEIVVSQTRVARSETIDTNDAERTKPKDGRKWQQKDGDTKKSYRVSETGIPRPKFNEISFKNTYDSEARIADRPSHAEISFKNTQNNSETRTPRQAFMEIPPDNFGRLLSMKWDQVCCQSVNCLRRYPLFPLLPSEMRFLRNLRVPISGKLYGERIFGRVAPPETGAYTFLVKCPNTCELWLGENEYPRSSKLFIKMVRGKAVNVTDDQQKPNFDVVLRSGRRYFVDMLFTVYRQSYDPFEVLWKLPNAGKFSSITQRFFSGFLKKPRSLRITLSVLSGAPSTRLTPFLEAIEEAGEDDEDFRTIGNEKDSADTFYDHQGMVIPFNTSLRWDKSLPSSKMSSEAPSLPYLRSCDSTPADLTAKSYLAKYEGVWKTSFSSVYPNDKTGFMMCIGNRYPLDCQGNKRISNKTVQKLLSLFTTALSKHNLRLHARKVTRMASKTKPELKVTDLVNIEQTSDAQNDFRFLLDVALTDLRSNSTILRSQYLHMDKKGTSLCAPRGFTIDLRRTVNVVVVAKGQSRWLRQFLANMEKVYLNTNDKHLNIIIAKYGRDDTKLMEEYARNRLPTIRTVRNFGKFHKTKAIQSAVDTIQDQNSIVFLMDLHILVPDTMMALVRKHTLKEKLVFNPVLFRLSHCGSQATAAKPPRGFWETFGYGILGIYKSDWDRIGGMSSKNYSLGWGGEDWELLDRIVAAGLEVDRMRVPHFYHFYHSKKGMWN